VANPRVLPIALQTLSEDEEPVGDGVSLPFKGEGDSEVFIALLYLYLYAARVSQICCIHTVKELRCTRGFIDIPNGIVPFGACR